MRIITVLLLLSIFTIGFGTGGLIALNIPTDQPVLETKTVMHRGIVTNSLQAQPAEEKVLQATTTQITPNNGLTLERDSPFDRIAEQDIEMHQDGVFIKLNEPQWAVFADTNSMDPVFDQGHHAIQIVPKTKEEVHVGDIISYRSPMGFSIIHRVTKTGYDDKGWYAIVQGDNNNTPDPEKVRFEDITRVVVAVIY